MIRNRFLFWPIVDRFVPEIKFMRPHLTRAGCFVLLLLSIVSMATA